MGLVDLLSFLSSISSVEMEDLTHAVSRNALHPSRPSMYTQLHNEALEVQHNALTQNADVEPILGSEFEGSFMNDTEDNDQSIYMVHGKDESNMERSLYINKLLTSSLSKSKLKPEHDLRNRDNFERKLKSLAQNEDQANKLLKLEQRARQEERLEYKDAMQASLVMCIHQFVD